MNEADEKLKLVQDRAVKEFMAGIHNDFTYIIWIKGDFIKHDSLDSKDILVNLER